MDKKREILLDKAIYSLQGTCSTMYTTIDFYGIDEDSLTDEDFYGIDENIYNCSVCGWRYEPGDQDEDGKCAECRHDEE